MPTKTPTQPDVTEKPARDFYRKALKILDNAQIPYLVGGGYALRCHSAVCRPTKDMDLFIQPEDCPRVLAIMSEAGYRTEMPFPAWLAKALHGQYFIDFLYGSGNGLCVVDDEWFSNALQGKLFGRLVPLCPVEEIIWSKAFVQERDRFDGPDVAHLLLGRAQRMDWHRLIRRFSGHHRVLLAHLILFGYIYPSERWRVPGWVMDELVERMNAEPAVMEHVCQGTFLSHNQYDVDVQQWGYLDGRLAAGVSAPPEPVAQER